jgi:hypothetical protein
MDTFYRVGGKQPRNVYRVTPEHPEGEYIGVFFDERDAWVAVAALNIVHSMVIPNTLELP